MEATQKSKLDMYRAVARHCAENFSLISSMPALLDTFNALTGLISAIDNTIKQHSQETSGIAIGKRKSRKSLAREAATLASKIFAYAEVAGNDALKERVRFTYSEISRLKDNELPATCMIILDAANENLAALAAYNVTAATISSLRDSIDAYKALQPHPRTASTDKANFNKELKAHFKNGDALLKNQMDKITEEFIKREPKFYARYVSNRIIVDPATTSTQIKGEVTSSHSGKAIPGAIITITETNITATTNRKGTYVMKKPEPGTYTITISMPGYKSQTVSLIQVKLGQIAKVNFELVEG